MQVEIRLKEILRRHGRWQHGIERKLAEYCGVDRHVIGKLLRNQVKRPSLEVLGKLSRWLIDNAGVPEDQLPQALLGAQPPKLWRAIGVAPRVAVYLGSRHIERPKGPVPARRSISRRDAQLESQITALLSSGEMGMKRPVRAHYVPFRFSQKKSQRAKGQFEEDKKGAQNLFKKMREAQPDENAILIGSQRANHVVEVLMADLFGCKPFVLCRKEIRIPVYLAYRNFDRPVPSCFGGRGNPPGRKGKVRPGTYYRKKTEKGEEWALWEWKECTQDAGMVVISYDKTTQGMELGAFGFSGWSTRALESQLFDEKKCAQFWPPAAEKSGRQVGVYICEMTFREKKPSSWGDEVFEVDEISVVALEKDVLEKYLR